MKNVLKIFLIGLAIGTIVFTFDLIAMYNQTGSFVLAEGALITFAYYLFYSIPLTFVNSFFFAYINEKISWHKRYAYKLLISVLGSAVVSLITVFLVRVILVVLVKGQVWAVFIENENASFYILCLIITAIVSLAIQVIYYYKSIKDSQVKVQKVIAGTASAKFDALKNQLDPHFLFNSLNVLSSLIDENPNNAKKFTTALSVVYRYVLEQKNKDLVLVDEELRFANTYISLLKMRFEDSITYEAPTKASKIESKIVPMSLQLLLENAVKHNVISSSRPLRIKIYEDNGHLIVENNLQKKQILKKSSGVGLSNIMERYDILSNRKVIINQSAERFGVALPMLTKNIKMMEANRNPKLNNKYLKARRRVEELKEFYFSLIAYCIIMPLLFLVWFWRTPDSIQWFWFPIIGWGIGLMFHSYKVFVNDGWMGSSWEQRKIEEYMRNEKKVSNK